MWSWNANKNAANQYLHEVSFQEAQEVFDDQLSATRPDPEHSWYEQRFQTIGMTHSRRLLFVVHTWDEETQSGRIVSAREPTPHERADYERGNF